MTAKEIIEKARRSAPGNYNRTALEAFERGEDYHPPCFEYGLGVGNPVSDLVSKSGHLYYVKRMPEYRYQLEEVA